MKLFTKRNIIITLFVVFLFLRLFVDKPAILLGSDNLKFLETSKRFPTHTLFNDQLYLLHPPFYPYIIHFFDLFMEDYIAAMFISLVSAAITFFVLYGFFMMLTKDFKLTFFILVFFTLSVEYIIASRAVLRESFLIMLIISTIYLFIKGIKFDNKKLIMVVSILGGILSVTSDHVVFLIPALVLSYVIFNNKRINLRKVSFPNIGYLAIPLIIILVSYGSWVSIKYCQYSKEDYYPNGRSGMPIYIQNLGLKQAISPQFFDDYHDTSQVLFVFSGISKTIKRLVFNLGYMFNLEPFSIPRGLNFTTMKYLLSPQHVAYILLIYLPLALITLYGLFYMVQDIFKKRKIQNNVNLYIIGLFFIFVFPVTQTYSSPRYIYIAYIFLFYFIGYGLVTLFNKTGKISVLSKIIPIMVILLLLLTPFWYYNNGHLALFRKKVISAQNTGDFIKNNLPENAVIMTQPGYTAKIIYLTGNKAIGMHHTQERLPEIIDYYGVDYIVFGRFYTDYYYYSLKPIEFIKNNPHKFELIATIKEDYSEFYISEDKASTDEVYVYKVIKNKI